MNTLDLLGSFVLGVLVVAALATIVKPGSQGASVIAELGKSFSSVINAAQD